ncbi:MAG TPA: ABC transporter ATP-binding protein [Bacillota bacterium]|nr:ABC transporter ATP-binding protein [Bacillota bacterium]
MLEVRNLQKYFPIQKGVLRKTVGWVKAVDNVSFSIKAGETLGLVGESGCGKTTTGRCILQLEHPTGGEIDFYPTNEKIPVTRKTIKSLRKDLQIIFQDPYSSLNPRMTIEKIVAEPLITHGLKNKSEISDRVKELLNSVGLSGEHMRRFPHEFSGGQRQRIGIARALALNPKLIICDEPVSALDVSIQAQVINLLEDLQERLGLKYLFIAHDLSVVNYICDRVAVMYLGQIVELTGVDELFESPRHPYTEALFSAIPVPDPDFQFEQIILEGDVPSPSNPPRGCYFHPRCRFAQEICKHESALLKPLPHNPNHFSSCHLADQLTLKGVRVSA